MKKVLSSPIALIVGIAAFAFGLVHFVRLAVLPRLPRGRSA